MLRRSLSAKIAATYLVLVLIISALLSFGLYWQFQAAGRRAVQNHLEDILDLAAPQVEGSYHARIRTPQDQSTEFYRRVRMQLRSIQSASDIIRHIYTLRQQPDGSFVYVVDANPDFPNAVGQPYTRPSTVLANEIFTGTQSMVEGEFHTTPEGTFLSAYAPIYDQFQQIDGLLGTDIDVSHILINEAQAFRTALITFLLVATPCLLLGWWMSQRLTLPVTDLMVGAHRVTQGHLDQSVPVRSQDEIGQLAEAFNRMTAQLRASLQALQNSEARYRSLFENSPVALGEQDFSTARQIIESLRAQGVTDFRAYFESHPEMVNKILSQVQVLDMNKASSRLYGASSKNKMMGRLERLIPPEARTFFREHLIQIAEGATEYTSETVNRTLAGEKIDLLLHWSVMPGYESSLAKVIVSIEDISARKHAEQEIQRLNAELERLLAERTVQLEASTRELDAFAYSVAHDLRSPLRAIDGFSQALLEDYGKWLDEQAVEHLERVRSASQRMGQMIDDLLTLSRIARVEFRRTDIDLSGIVQAIARRLQRSQPERQVEFVIEPGISIRADARMIKAMMENLLENAWKFTSKHAQARIEFGVVHETGAKQEGPAVYFVRDDGAGFNMNYAQKLFGTFQRLHSVHEFSGSGIGLAIVQRIVQRHGGRIWAEGATEKGAIFYFTLSA